MNPEISVETSKIVKENGIVKYEAKYTQVTQNFEVKTFGHRNPQVTLRKDLLAVDWAQDIPEIAFAGGHILNAVIPDEEASLSGDVDAFLVGPEKSTEEIRSIVKKVFQNLKARYGKEPFVNFRPFSSEWVTGTLKRKASSDASADLVPNPVVANSVIFKIKDARCVPNSNLKKPLKVQLVISNQFATMEDLLRSFDLNNCQFGYYDGHVTASADAIQYLKDKIINAFIPANEPHLRARRMERIKKYVGRKYNTLNMCKECPPNQSVTDMLDYENPKYKKIELFAGEDEAMAFLRE